MIIVIVILIAVLVLLMFQLLLGAKNTGPQSVNDRLQSFQRPNAPVDIVRYESEKLNRPLVERLFGPLLEEIFSVIMKITPGNIYTVALKKKTGAGNYYRGSVGSFICLWLISAAAMPLVTAYYCLIRATDINFFNGLLFIGAGFIVGAYLPLLVMNIFIAKRKALILKQLPEMLDLVCVSVQAGLSFDGALTKVSEYMEGPLVDECRKMLQEVKMGTTRREALVNLAGRCDIQEISLFTAAIIQSDRLGVPLAKTLVIQSTNMRERRRQTVKALALKAPVKIILPLVIFIFPSVFIIALGPSILTLMKSFK